MSWLWNNPPGWPEPPPGWLPPKNWVPQPEWPQPPADWNYYIDENTIRKPAGENTLQSAIESLSKLATLNYNSELRLADPNTRSYADAKEIVHETYQKEPMNVLGLMFMNVLFGGFAILILLSAGGMVGWLIAAGMVAIMAFFNWGVFSQAKRNRVILTRRAISFFQTSRYAYGLIEFRIPMENVLAARVDTSLPTARIGIENIALDTVFGNLVQMFAIQNAEEFVTAVNELKNQMRAELATEPASSVTSGEAEFSAAEPTMMIGHRRVPAADLPRILPPGTPTTVPPSDVIFERKIISPALSSGLIFANVFLLSSIVWLSLMGETRKALPIVLFFMFGVIIFNVSGFNAFKWSRATVTRDALWVKTLLPGTKKIEYRIPLTGISAVLVGPIKGNRKRRSGKLIVDTTSGTVFAISGVRDPQSIVDAVLATKNGTPGGPYREPPQT